MKSEKEEIFDFLDINYDVKLIKNSIVYIDKENDCEVVPAFVKLVIMSLFHAKRRIKNYYSEILYNWTESKLEE